MKLLILTQYFPPEVGAPQNRLFELALRLQQQGWQVDILTAMPNYPKMKIQEAYKGKWLLREEMFGLSVYRSWIYVSTAKSIFKRLINYFSFVKSSAIYGTFGLPGKYDLIICESPPLFLGISALWLCFIKRARLVFNVSDLWPETAEQLGLVKNKFLLKLSYRLEKLLYQKSVLITGQTQGICENISKRFPDKTTWWLPNGVDLDYYDAAKYSTKWKEQAGFAASDCIALYAGILGYAQGLEVILYAAQLLKEHQEIKWVILGNGPEKEKLENLSHKLGLRNVFFIEGVGKEKMPEVIAATDVAIVPLKKLDLFKGAIPSKIFENLAMKKPILLGVEGEAKKLFIEEGRCGFAFEPENASDLAAKMLVLYQNKTLRTELGNNALDYVSKQFNRNNIARNFAEKLRACTR